MPLCYLAKSNAMQKGKTTLHPVQQQSLLAPLPCCQPSIKQELQLTHSSVIISLFFFAAIYEGVCVYLHVCRCRQNELQPSAVARFSSCSKDSPCPITPLSTSPHLAFPCLAPPRLALATFLVFAVFSLQFSV